MRGQFDPLKTYGQELSDVGTTPQMRDRMLMDRDKGIDTQGSWRQFEGARNRAIKEMDYHGQMVEAKKKYGEILDRDFSESSLQEAKRAADEANRLLERAGADQNQRRTPLAAEDLLEKSKRATEFSKTLTDMVETTRKGANDALTQLDEITQESPQVAELQRMQEEAAQRQRAQREAQNLDPQELMNRLVNDPQVGRKGIQQGMPNDPQQREQYLRDLYAERSSQPNRPDGPWQEGVTAYSRRIGVANQLQNMEQPQFQGLLNNLVQAGHIPEEQMSQFMDLQGDARGGLVDHMGETGIQAMMAGGPQQVGQQARQEQGGGMFANMMTAMFGASVGARMAGGGVPPGRWSGGGGGAQGGGGGGGAGGGGGGRAGGGGGGQGGGGGGGLGGIFGDEGGGIWNRLGHISQITSLMGALGNASDPQGAATGLAPGNLMSGGGQMLMGAAPFMGPLAPAGLIAGGALTAGGTAANLYFGQAEQQRQREAQFGTPFGTGPGDIINDLTRPGGLSHNQLQARWENPFLTGQQIQELTQELANLGQTAGEAATAIRPAARAMQQFPFMTGQQAARYAAEGQRGLAPHGAANAAVMGGLIQDLSGQGISTQGLQQAGQQGREALQAYGTGPQNEVAGLAAAASYGGTGQTAYQAEQQGLPGDILNITQGFADPNNFVQRGMSGIDPNAPASGPEAVAATQDVINEKIKKLLKPGTNSGDKFAPPETRREPTGGEGEPEEGHQYIDPSKVRVQDPFTIMEFQFEFMTVPNAEAIVSNPQKLATQYNAAIDTKGGDPGERARATGENYENRQERIEAQTTGELAQDTAEGGGGGAGFFDSVASAVVDPLLGVTAGNALRGAFGWQGSAEAGRAGSYATEGLYNLATENEMGSLSSLATQPGVRPREMDVYDAEGNSMGTIEDMVQRGDTENLEKLESGEHTIQTRTKDNWFFDEYEQRTASDIAEGITGGTMEATGEGGVAEKAEGGGGTIDLSERAAQWFDLNNVTKQHTGANANAEANNKFNLANNQEPTNLYDGPINH